MHYKYANANFQGFLQGFNDTGSKRIVKERAHNSRLNNREKCSVASHEEANVTPETI